METEPMHAIPDGESLIVPSEAIPYFKRAACASISVACEVNPPAHSLCRFDAHTQRPKLFLVFLAGFVEGGHLFGLEFRHFLGPVQTTAQPVSCAVNISWVDFGKSKAKTLRKTSITNSMEWSSSFSRMTL